MAFPTTITTVGDVNEGGARPFLSSAGNVYVIVRDNVTTSKLRAFKATDPTSSFSNVGTDPQVTSTHAIQGYATYQVGDVIHIVTQDCSVNTSVDLRYHKFDMSSDSWSLTNEAIVTAVSTSVAVASHQPSITVRSSGDVIVLYNGATTAIMGSNRTRVYYARRVTGTWTVDVVVDNAGATNWYTGGIVLGSSDRSHFYFQDNNATSAYERCLTSANVLETFPTSFDTTIASATYALHNLGISYDASGTQKVRFPVFDSIVSTVNSAKCDSADTPTMSEDSDITGATNADTGTDGFHSGFSANGTTLWHVFDDTNNDIYTQSNANDGGWSTPASFYTGTVTKLYCNIYTRNGDIVLAMVFTETNPKYTEKVLLAGDTTPKDVEWDCQFGFSCGRARR